MEDEHLKAGRAAESKPNGRWLGQESSQALELHQVSGRAE